MRRNQSKDLLERIGIAAIVVSLAFVAYEVRQNANAIKSNVIQSVSQQSIDSIAQAIDNEELRKAIAASLDGNATPDQRTLMDLQFTIYLRIQTNRYLQSELGVVSREMVIVVGG